MKGIAAKQPAQALAQAVAQGRFEEETLLLRKGGCPYWARLVITALRDKAGALRGFALVLRDVTRHKLDESEREQLLENLKTALVDVKILSGLVPICVSCKKVRDYRGQWHALEAFLRTHSEATLVHQFCPDCAQQIQASAVGTGAGI